MTTVEGLILIVDDTPTNLEVISEALSDAGFDVAIAISGERALQQIERKLPDLILLDIMMPGIDGFETCQRLKDNPRTRDIPIIFMTALADTDSKVQALELGAVDYITKPFQEEEVLARVKTHLQLYYLTQTLERQVERKTSQLQASQLRLLQSEKMSALGQLVAGVAHEINNPLGFLQGNLLHTEEYIKNLLCLVDVYQKNYPQPVNEVEQEIEDIDLGYLREDLPKLVESMQTGIHRIKNISDSLRTFSRSDHDRPVFCNIHEGIDSTIHILKYRLNANDQRPAIQILKKYGQLPPLECYAGQLNQVFMNILANAVDMFDEIALLATFEELKNHPQKIIIQTTILPNKNIAEIRIRDNGIGMKEEVKARVFDYLFTTKGVGKGTGLGLSIAHQIVTEIHAGSLDLQSEFGQGTEFCIQLPICC